MHTHFHYRAYYVAEKINLSQYKNDFTQYLESSNTAELYYNNGKHKYLLIFNYGVVVFCNYDEEIVKFILNKLKPYCIAWRDSPAHDDLDVSYESQKGLMMDFDSLTIGRFDNSVNRMIMMHLAQSVAMDHFNLISQNLLGSIKEYTSYLGKHGKISLSEKKALKFIGRTLSAKNNIAENLYIFDSPDNTWEDEYLDLLHKKLVNHFELAPRYKSIEGTLKIIEDNLDVHISYNHHRESSRLEWIIIILIVIEVVDTLLSKFI